MATSLQQQLAAIAAKSQKSLDLKALKTRHGKSLLFEPRDAASQSFEVLYQICNEGFEELCMLDARFTPFARNLFSEQSKYEDRTQMTARENEELDKILDSFLGLVCARLLLKPAMKAVEWLVRRFRVQEYNTQSMLLTFLPYHTSHLFPTLLSILPDHLPPSFSFLHPYVASLQSPPRHAIVGAATSNAGFFSAFSQYILAVAKARHHSPLLIGFWVSTTAQAVSGMIRTTKSGRDAIRRQREEDLLLRVLPILQSALNTRNVPELYLGACMITTVLAMEASLDDKVLDALMEAVAGGWSEQTVEHGLSCLAFIAEEKQQHPLPSAVVRTILKHKDALPLFVQLHQTQRISRLATGCAIGSVVRASKTRNVADLQLATGISVADLLPDVCVVHLLDAAMSNLMELRGFDPAGEVCQAMSGLLTNFAHEPERITLLEQAARHANLDLRALQLPLLSAEVDDVPEPEPIPHDPMEIGPRSLEREAQIETFMTGLPHMHDTSFLDQAFYRYCTAFQAVLASDEEPRRFLSARAFKRSRRVDRVELVTFLARSWTSNATAAAKIRSIQIATTTLSAINEHNDTGIDMQALMPYIITALADPSRKIRDEVAKLCLVTKKLFKKDRGKGALAWATGKMYGKSTSSISSMSSEESYKFLKAALLPSLEDSVTDSSYIIRSLTEVLNQDGKELKKGVRHTACVFLASHARQTPVLRVRLILLRILNGVGKAMGDTRVKVLLPLLRGWSEMNQHEISRACSSESLDSEEVDSIIVAMMSHRTSEELSALEDIAIGQPDIRKELSAYAFQRLQHLWPRINSHSQISVVDFLLKLALGTSSKAEVQQRQDDALATLHKIQLPTEVLIHTVDSLPNASDMQDQAPSAKRQRTNRAEASQPRTVDAATLQAAVQRITLVLGLVESSKPGKHSQLLRGLFHVLGELRLYKNLTGSDLVYLQQLSLSCILAVIEALKTTSDTTLDRSFIRTDVIVECVRSTPSTQIHNNALLLVSSLASWAPELVLHSVMPLFTFMSANTLRQSDDYSAHVTDQTVARIIPPLAASLKMKGKDLVSGASELLLSFTAAFEHIPLHRRAGLFEHLIETLGPDETLFAILAMLVERYPTDSRVPAFVADLVNHFSTISALGSAVKYVDLIFDALKSKRGLSDILLGLSDKTETEIEDTLVNLLEGLARMLQNVLLRQRLASELDENSEISTNMRSAYASLLEKSMQLARDLGSNEVLGTHADYLLGSVLGLMPTKDFIQSSAQLMQTGSDQTRQQVFRSLEARVAQAKRADTASQKVFLDVLSNCGAFIRPDQPVATRHAAISCIDQIAEKYGRTDRGSVLEAANKVAGGAALGSEVQSLRVVSILCLASMIDILGDDCIPALPSVLTQALGYLQDNASDTSLQNATFGLVNAVLDHLPWMLSSDYLDLSLKLAARVTAILEEGSQEATQDFQSLAAKKVSASELFAAIDRTWADVCTLGGAAVEYHLNTLHQAIGHHTKATVTSNAQTVFSIVLEAFDLRRRFQRDGSSGQADQVYALVDNIALELTLKLNDVTFRPFFIRLVEWATSALAKQDVEGRTLRETSLYSFALTLFNQLKSIVTSYASFLLESASEQLQRPRSGTPGGGELVRLVLQTLYSSFQHDQDDFWQAPAHFDAIANPLMGQLKHAAALQMSEDVIPAITELAASAASPEHLKTMNTTIMSYMRDEDSAVRLAAVQCERSISAKVNFDWLALLPEMLPFISELQEDDDEDVERETLRWVKQIEDITGESLEGMLA